MDRVLEPGETVEFLGAMMAKMEQIIATNDQLIAAQKRYIAELEQGIAGQKQKTERLGQALLTILKAAHAAAGKKGQIDTALAQAILDASRMCTDPAVESK
jgi:hypothetical protein